MRSRAYGVLKSPRERSGLASPTALNFLMTRRYTSPTYRARNYAVATAAKRAADAVRSSSERGRSAKHGRVANGSERRVGSTTSESRSADRDGQGTQSDRAGQRSQGVTTKSGTRRQRIQVTAGQMQGLRTILRAVQAIGGGLRSTTVTLDRAANVRDSRCISSGVVTSRRDLRRSRVISLAGREGARRLAVAGVR